MFANAPVVAIAISARAIARALVNAGIEVLALDLFADRDTRELSRACAVLPGDIEHGIDTDGLVDAIAGLAARTGTAPAGIVWGAGFEDRPEVLDTLARHWHLYGNDAATVRRLKDPETFTRTLDALAIARPETSLTPPADPQGWLVKRTGKSGGWHVRLAGADEATAPGLYFQRRVPGHPVSALFVADNGAATMIGFSEQWADPLAGAPYRYGGAVQPARLDLQTESTMRHAVMQASSAFALTGLNSADFVVDGTNAWLIEINPRPGATLDVFDDPAAPLMAIHLAPERTAGDVSRSGTGPVRAAAVVYADRTMPTVGHATWPDWTADRPVAGAQIEQGAPICTVLAEADDADTARRLIDRRMAFIRSML